MKRAFVIAVVAVVACASSAARADDEEARADEAPATPRPSPDPPTTYSLLASGGASYRHLFGSPAGLGVVGLGFGGDTGGRALYLRADYEGGRTDHGLAVHVVRLGGSIEGIIDRFRLGVGASMSVVTVFRVTQADSIDRFGVGLFGITSFDLARFDGHALYLGLRGDLDMSAHLWGGALALGLRL
jgi:hypothetical protein